MSKGSNGISEEIWSNMAEICRNMVLTNKSIKFGIDVRFDLFINKIYGPLMYVGAMKIGSECIVNFQLFAQCIDSNKIW